MCCSLFTRLRSWPLVFMDHLQVDKINIINITNIINIIDTICRYLFEENMQKDFPEPTVREQANDRGDVQ